MGGRWVRTCGRAGGRTGRVGGRVDATRIPMSLLPPFSFSYIAEPVQHGLGVAKLEVFGLYVYVCAVGRRGVS